MLGVIKDCIPIIVGALIVIIPTMVEKYFDRNSQKIENSHKNKQVMYVELISLFEKVLKNQSSSDIELLRNKINLISITGSVDVVKALNEYIDTWENESGGEQNKKYSELLKVIRVDLEVDKKRNKKFPEIGLRDITLKSNNGAE